MLLRQQPSGCVTWGLNAFVYTETKKEFFSCCWTKWQTSTGEVTLLLRSHVTRVSKHSQNKKKLVRDFFVVLSACLVFSSLVAFPSVGFFLLCVSSFLYFLLLLWLRPNPSSHGRLSPFSPLLSSSLLFSPLLSSSLLFSPLLLLFSSPLFSSLLLFSLSLLSPSKFFKYLQGVPPK